MRALLFCLALFGVCLANMSPQQSPKLLDGQFEWLVKLGQTKDAEREALLAQHHEWLTKEALTAASAALETSKPEEAKSWLPAGYGLIAASDKINAGPERALARLRTGRLEFVASNLPGAITLYKEALALADQEKQVDLQILCHGLLADALFRSNKLPEALQEYLTTIEVMERADKTDKRLPQQYFSAGSMYARTGQDAKAIPMYEKAIAMVGDANPTLKAQCLTNLGATQSRAGNRDRSIELFERAISIFESIKDTRGVAGCYMNIGADLGESGRLHEALAMFDKARPIFKARNDVQNTGSCALNTAIVAIRAGRLQEAATLLEEAWSCYQQTGFKFGQATCLQVESALLMIQSDFQPAQANLVRARTLFQEISMPARAAACDSSLGKVAFHGGQLEQALKLFTAAREAAGRGNDRLTHADALQGEAATLLELGRHQEAEKAVRAALALLEGTGLEKGIAVHRLLLGRALEHQGRLDEAVTAYELALKGVHALRATMPDAELATSAVASLESLGADIVGVKIRQAGPNAAFAALQRFKSSFLTEKAESVDTAILAKSLAPGAAVLDIAVGDRATYLVLIKAGAKEAVVKKVGVSNKDLGGWTTRYISSLQGSGGSADRQAAGQLYEHVFAPLEKELRGVTSLVICPDQVLHLTPFASLQDPKGKYLIERFELTVAPSASSWRSCVALADSRRQSKLKSNLVVAVSTFSKLPNRGAAVAVRGESLPDLPNVPKEADAVAKALGGGVTQLREHKATVESVTTTAKNAGLIHFASHAITNDRSPNAGVLVLAPKNARDSGLLYPQDVRKWRLKADLTVLSACATAEGRLTSGEGLLSLAWSFMVAGCPSTVATRWKVNDNAARLWIEAFYGGYAKRQSKAASYRAACLALLKTRGMAKDYSAPRYWACWTLLGSGH